MLIKDPNKRPSIRKILEKDFLSVRISQLLSNTVAKHEFSNTFLQKHLGITPGKSEDEKDSKDQISTGSRVSRISTKDISKSDLKNLILKVRLHHSHSDRKKTERREERQKKSIMKRASLWGRKGRSLPW